SDILVGQLLLKVDVVIKTAVDGWANRHLHIGKQLFNRMTEHVRTGATDNFQTVFVCRREDHQVSIFSDEIMRIDTLAINTTTQSRLGQASTNRCSNFIDRDGIIERTLGAVGEGNYRHGKSLVSGDPYERSHD